ncbi:MAG TPA: metallopeptidase family protein [Ktedonobacteraceae bacterium]|nr:metallopeptidase family protein [Ktedonobacteraceae bacterium]
MAEQDFYKPEESSSTDDEDYDYSREPEPDAHTLRSNEQRSRYFLAAMCFLLALLCLSAYLNNLPWLNATLLQLGAVLFAATGIFFLLRGSPANHEQPSSPTEQDEENHSAWLYENQHSEVAYHDEPTVNENGASEDEVEEDEPTPFEMLVQEALATIPPEFQERMANVFVRVMYEPGEETLRRVGTKEGYTLLGLYEGVPLTAYGRQQAAHLETITIYQHTIERYCHGDPDRIREQVRHTVLHEVAHHFGIDHDEMPIWIR